MEEPQTQAKHPLGHIVVVVVPVLVIIGAAVGGFIWVHRTFDPLPTDIIQAVNYDIYYPKQVPDGFGYKASSARLDGSNVIYRLVSGPETITVTQQAMPPSPPDLSHLPSFDVEPTTIGNGAFGLAGKSPAGIILAPSTLITLIGSGGATPGNIKDIANGLTATRAN